MRLNLGCADRRIDGFTGVDIAAGPEVDQIVDLEGPWPWPDSSVLEVRAHDVAEHIGDCNHMTAFCTQCREQWLRLYRAIYGEQAEQKAASVATRHPLGRIHFLNELCRVLVPGGLATIEVPDALQGAGFIQDPTHKTAWTRNMFQYFGAGIGGEFAHGRLSIGYGITAKFNLVSMERREYQDTYDKVWKITAVLEAVK